MKPNEVPTDLLDEACDRFFGTPAEPGDDREAMACALAAVLPAHERQVREHAASLIMDRADRFLKAGTITQDELDSYRDAAETARGGPLNTS